MKIYITPTITNDRILPDTALPDSMLGTSIEAKGAPGETVSATFTLKPDTDTTVAINPPDGAEVFAVKCWYQRENGEKVLVPELLLKDDSLVKVEGGENYLKMADGTYTLISYSQLSGSLDKRWDIDELSVQDAETLQPVFIKVNENKQFWFTYTIPLDAEPGCTIALLIEADQNTALLITITVRPIHLEEPALEHSIYSTARFSNRYPEGSISSHSRSWEQIEAELLDMKKHGITNPVCYQEVYQSPINESNLRHYFEIRKWLGMSGGPLFWIGHGPRDNQDPAQVPQILAIAREYGFPEVYFYGIDECLARNHHPSGTTDEEIIQILKDQIPAWEEIHSMGGKVFVAGVKQGHYSGLRGIGEFGAVGEHIDLFVAYGEPSREEAAKWHSIGKKIYNYADPVIGEQNPETYRRNYGLSLWQGDYDGTMPWAYNYGWGNPWNDFDASNTDQMFVYPTINGVIDTLSFEGWLAGIIDLRYIATLEEKIEAAIDNGVATPSALKYLLTLKSNDLSSFDLDGVRDEISQLINQIQEAIIPGGPPEPTPEPTPEPEAKKRYRVEGTLDVTLTEID